MSKMPVINFILIFFSYLLFHSLVIHCTTDLLFRRQGFTFFSILLSFFLYIYSVSILVHLNQKETPIAILTSKLMAPWYHWHTKFLLQSFNSIRLTDRLMIKVTFTVTLSKDAVDVKESCKYVTSSGKIYNEHLSSKLLLLVQFESKTFCKRKKSTRTQ